jgi:hypothetical protein
LTINNRFIIKIPNIDKNPESWRALAYKAALIRDNIMDALMEEVYINNDNNKIIGYMLILKSFTNNMLTTINNKINERK